jgi:hypothetical protein
MGTINKLGGTIFLLNGAILMWGYAKGVQVQFGGMQKITVLIWGYASTKRLRNPGLK